MNRKRRITTSLIGAIGYFCASYWYEGKRMKRNQYQENLDSFDEEETVVE